MAQKQVAWNSGAGYIKLTYTGHGNGSIIVDSDENNLGTARSQVVTVQTEDGVKSVNLTVSQGACPFPVGTAQNFDYTGNVQSVLLPAGKYKLQCWGAQGGSNAAASSYGITEQEGGKGGYSEGVLTLTSPTTVYVFVGGQGGSSGNGGWNGGGGGSGAATYDSGDEQGVSRMGCGGGATDISLVTSSMSYSSYRNSRSSASLLARMIVAGGGGGGAMAYQKLITTTYDWSNVTYAQISVMAHANPTSSTWYIPASYYFEGGKTYRLHGPSTINVINVEYYNGSTKVANVKLGMSNYDTFTIDPTYLSQSTRVVVSIGTTVDATTVTDNIYLDVQTSSTSTTEDRDSQVGYVGGGITGGGYSNSYKGRQNAAGSGGEFGKGANDTVSNYRYCAGCGGGGWYGGGSTYADGGLATVRYSGGGSGWVNTAASAGNRPSGYTGLQLDSGETKDGNTSFEAPGGGIEVGHSGNGYARITRLE